MFDTANFFAWVVAFIIGVSLREAVKAWVATRLGDRTPSSQGRLTLNPTAHHQPLGLILAFIASMGYPVMAWGKPVEFNTFSLRGGRRGLSLIAAAGLLTNLVVAWLIWLASSSYIKSVAAVNFNTGRGDLIARFLVALIVVNLLLFAFNLLPIPPLDGYLFFKGFTPAKWDLRLINYEEIGLLILVVINFIIPFVFGIFSRNGSNPFFTFIFYPIVQWLFGIMGINSTV